MQNAQAQLVNGEHIADIQYRLLQDSTLCPRLAERLENVDTTLTLKELGTLYYGYALQPGYSPVREERIIDAANALARREKYSDAMNLLGSFLEKNPGCLSAHLERAYTAYQMEDSLATVQNYKKYYMLLDVPVSSGDGNSLETAFVVSSERDMELVLDAMGYFPEKRSLVQNDGQHFYLVTSHLDGGDRKLKKNFYFNVDLVVKGMRVGE